MGDQIFDKTDSFILILLKKIDANRTKHASIFLPILILIGVMVVYSNTLSYKFNLDDHLSSAQNQLVQLGFSGIDDILSAPYLDESDARYGGYRPVPRISHAIEFGLWGDRPSVAHGVNIFFYLVCCYLTFLFFQQTVFESKNNSLWIWLGVAIFAFHPLHVEVVASLKNREVLLAFLFGMGFVLTFLSASKTIIQYIASFLLLTLSIFCKLDSLIFPVFTILVLLFRLPKNWVKDIVLIFSMTGILLAINYFIQQSFPEPLNLAYTIEENPLINKMGTLPHFSTVLFIILYLSRLIFFPNQQLFFYGTGKIDLVEGVDLLVLLSLIIHLLIFVFAIYSFKKKKGVGLFLMMYLACIGLNSNLLILVPGIIGDRLLFAAILPFAGIIISGFLLIKERYGSKLPDFAFFTFPILFIAFSFFYSNSRVPCWKSGYTLGKCDMPALSKSMHANTIYIKLLATEITEEQNISKKKQLIQASLSYSKKALELNPTSLVALNNIGSIYCEQRDSVALGSKILLEGLKIDPNSALILRSLGNCFKQANDETNALKFYEAALKNADFNIDLRYKMFTILVNQGKTTEAKIYLDEMIDRAPAHKSTLLSHGMWFAATGDNLNATKKFEEILERYPDMVELQRMVEAYYRSVGK